MWTNEQLLAIEGEGDILVSAGAGSGKTAVLTERTVRLIREGADMREILCLTFTVAAASEMKKRIERALDRAALETSDPKDAKRLHTEARAASNAAISTIDSFCMQVLRRHFDAAELDPAFRVCDTNEVRILRDAVWDELIEERYSTDSARFTALVDALGDDMSMMDAAEAVYDYSRSKAESEAWLSGCLDKYSVTAEDVENSAETAELISDLIEAVTFASEGLCEAKRNVYFENKNVASFIEEELELARSLTKIEDRSALLITLSAGADHSGSNMKRMSYKGVDDADAERIKSARKRLSEAMKAAREFLETPSAERAKRINAQRPLIEELIAVTEDFASRFSAAKAEKNACDYADLEHKTYELFKREEIAGEYKRRFKYVFLDEYQDCNGVNEAIVSRITRRGGSFMVGDVKQSIYRFRLAEPELFMRRYEAYKDKEKGSRIDLNANFRSAGGVIEAVNGVFDKLMHTSVAEIEYDAHARLVHGREERENGDAPRAAEFHLIDLMERGDAIESDDEAEAPEEYEAPLTAAAEAEKAAELIRNAMERDMISDGEGGLRKPKYGDFAVLLRSGKNAVESWLDTLTAFGIPCYAEAAGGFFSAVEVRIFLDLLKTIDNRAEDIPLAATMRSAIGGFTLEELIELRLDAKNAATLEAEGEKNEPGAPDVPSSQSAQNGPGGLARDLELIAKLDTALGVKCRAFIAKLDAWRRGSRLVGVESFIGSLLDETDFVSYCRALPGGRQREANLEALLDRARECERTGARSLFSFLRYAEKLADDNSTGTPQTAGADVVRIMTVHASKGLEFPYVILGGLSRRFNLRTSAIALDSAMGIGAHFLDKGVRTASLYTEAIESRARKKSIAEEMRILYVAMTRAREKLMLIAANGDVPRALERALSPLNEGNIARARSFMEWLLLVIMHSSDGNILRERYGLNKEAGLSPLGIDVYPACAPYSRLMPSRMTEAAFDKRLEEAPESEESLERLFAMRYPFERDTLVPSKVSVTGLAGHEITMAEAPDFLLTERMSATDRGTAAHKLMQYLPLMRHTEESVRREAERLAASGYITDAERDAADAKLIAAFFASPLGMRLLASGEVRREAEFDLRIGARELLGLDSDETVILQGVIDCCFIEDGEWVIVDYKTDRIVGSATATAQKHYRQLSLYARALELLTGRRVSEGYIFLLQIGEAVEILKL